MAGQLVQVDHFTISSPVASVIIGGGSSGSSSTNFAINTDDVYMFTYHNVFMSVDGATFSTRFTVLGTEDSSANYDQAQIGMYTNQASFKSGNPNLTFLTNYGMGTTPQESQCGIWYLYNFNNSSEYSFINHESVNITEAPEIVGQVRGAVLTVAQSCDGIKLYASSGNIASGTFTLYRVV
jgi:hypothetical protein